MFLIKLFIRRNSVENQLNELVMDGPVNKPNLINLMILEKLLKTGYEKEIIDEELSKIKNEIKKYSAQVHVFHKKV